MVPNTTEVLLPASPFYAKSFVLLVFLCIVLSYYFKESSPPASDNVDTDETKAATKQLNGESSLFTKFKLNYLVVYAIVILSDWLQGPYIYALYRSYGYDLNDIAILFIVGFLSSAVFGTLVGSVADRFGRKRLCLVFCVLYTISCLTKLSSTYTVLLFGRLTGGISTSLLFSVFEAWMVSEHFSRGFSSNLLGDIFSWSTFVNGLVAIISGLIANFVVPIGGFVAPFMVAVVCLLVGAVVIASSWNENYGEKQANAQHMTIMDAVKVIREDFNILAIGTIQSLFESAMYSFVFLYPPVLEAAAGKNVDLPYGFIFASFMVAIMIGSVIFRAMLSAGYTHEEIARATLAVACVSFLIPVVVPDNQFVLFWSFCSFELCCGLYFPTLGTLRGKLIPEEIRATVMNVFRVPLNLIVVVVLLKVDSLPKSTLFTVCSILMGVAFYFASKVNSNGGKDVPSGTDQNSSLTAIAASWGNSATAYPTDTGAIAMMTWSTSLIFIQIMGLALYHSGLARTKNTLTVMAMTILAVCTVLVQWTLFGFSLAYSETGSQFGGNCAMCGLANVGANALIYTAPAVPSVTFYLQQGMVAALAVSIVFGAVAERIRLVPGIIFVVIWTTAVYDVAAYWTWAHNGWLRNIGTGIYDLAGGGPVNIAAGFSALAFLLVVGRFRRAEVVRPSNLVNVMIGTGLATFGWFGLTTGSLGAMTTRASVAFASTALAASSSALSWTIASYMAHGRVSASALCQGLIAGLVAITPGSSFMAPWAAILVGISSGFFIQFLTKIKYLLGIEDHADVFAIYGLGGIWGMLMAGIFSQTSVIGLDNSGQVGGWMDQHFVQVLYQFVGSMVIAAWAFAITFVSLTVLAFMPGTHLRPSDEEEYRGSDLSELGEYAYDILPANAYESAYDEPRSASTKSSKASLSRSFSMPSYDMKTIDRKGSELDRVSFDRFSLTSSLAPAASSSSFGLGRSKSLDRSTFALNDNSGRDVKSFDIKSNNAGNSNGRLSIDTRGRPSTLGSSAGRRMLTKNGPPPARSQRLSLRLATEESSKTPISK
ncbi:hypothetical protein SmJEL517_g01338 [Synchytrium microbalum]|uniref:Molybdate-anion transporter n=1 Tax=Synchytrium microbalum TaxID=1806994 RepID=A0A507CF15_9FUNG|nr:uncharacterized protein SmJEL517_g01338 [Synchytrium microbalum]TPX36504.1 hypothetical protein SmJEL517_g01338 [Synchytrium microbalum]